MLFEIDRCWTTLRHILGTGRCKEHGGVVVSQVVVGQSVGVSANLCYAVVSAPELKSLDS